MKVHLYPQLFDKTGRPFKKEGEYNKLYYKYKAAELEGYSLQKYDELQQNDKMLEKTIKLPLILLVISTFLLVVLISGICSAMPDVGIKQGYQNAPVLFWLVPVFLASTIAAYLFFRYKRKKYVLAMTELSETIGKEVDRLIEEDLKIPPDAKGVCFFQRVYRTGKTKPFCVFCEEFLAFPDEENVYIYWDAAIFKIPKRDCLTAESINAKTGYFDQMPSVDYKSPEVKQFKIRKNSETGMFNTKHFGRLLFVCDGETWTLDVPPFSFENIKTLFGK